MVGATATVKYPSRVCEGKLISMCESGQMLAALCTRSTLVCVCFFSVSSSVVDAIVSQMSRRIYIACVCGLTAAEKTGSELTMQFITQRICAMLVEVVTLLKRKWKELELK